MRLSTEKAIEFVENLEKYHPIQKFWDESNERHRQEKNTENYPYSYFRGVLIRKIAEIIEALQQENEQLQELAKAKADGRMVVLPCKTEDTVFIVYAKKILETTVDKRAWTDDDGYMLRTKEEWFKEKDIGKTVFLSREEAEKALEMRE